MPLSGAITSADPISVSTLPGNYLPICCYIEKIYKIVILYGCVLWGMVGDQASEIVWIAEAAGATHG